MKILLTFGLHCPSKLLVSGDALGLAYSTWGSGVPISHLVVVDDGDTVKRQGSVSKF